MLCPLKFWAKKWTTLGHRPLLTTNNNKVWALLYQIARSPFLHRLLPQPVNWTRQKRRRRRHHLQNLRRAHGGQSLHRNWMGSTVLKQFLRTDFFYINTKKIEILYSCQLSIVMILLIIYNLLNWKTFNSWFLFFLSCLFLKIFSAIHIKYN